MCLEVGKTGYWGAVLFPGFQTQLEAVRAELIEMTTDRNRMIERCRQLEDVVNRIEEEKTNGDRRRDEMDTAMGRMEREIQVRTRSWGILVWSSYRCNHQPYTFISVERIL